MSTKEYSVKFRVELSSLRKELATARAEIAKSASLGIDTGQAEKKIDAIRRAMIAFRREPIASRVDVRTEDARKSLSSLRLQVSSLRSTRWAASKAADIRVNAKLIDTQPRAAMGNLRAQARQISSAGLTIRGQAEFGDIFAKLDDMRGRLARI